MAAVIVFLVLAASFEVCCPPHEMFEELGYHRYPGRALLEQNKCQSVSYSSSIMIATIEVAGCHICLESGAERGDRPAS